MKSAKIRISIILPFYNAEKTLLRAIESIAIQSYKNFECILVDNNSDDKSSKIAGYICRKDKRFHLIREERQGVVFASNGGSKLASGDYICRMDADDEFTPESLEIREKYLRENPSCDVVAGLAEYVPHHENTAGFQRYVNWSNSVKSYGDILINRFCESPVINPTAMWKKEISRKYGMYRHGRFPEDYELWLRWLDAGVVIQKINKNVLRWHDSYGRLTRTGDNYNEASFFELKAVYLSGWLGENNPHFPDVWIWGASRRSRRWSRYLKDNDVRIKAYIDIHRRRWNPDERVVFYRDIPSPEEVFIIVYNRHHGQKERIAEFLEGRGFTAGENYLFAG